jgi:hypothetical protein
MRRQASVTVPQLLQGLRAFASSLRNDRTGADTLVTFSIEQALIEIDSIDPTVEIELWLQNEMRLAHHRRDPRCFDVRWWEAARRRSQPRNHRMRETSLTPNTHYRRATTTLRVPLTGTASYWEIGPRLLFRSSVGSLKLDEVRAVLDRILRERLLLPASPEAERMGARLIELYRGGIRNAASLHAVAIRSFTLWP